MSLIGVILVFTVWRVNCADPLEKPLSLLKLEVEQGCDVIQLPDSIVWCNGSLNEHKRLPVNTWCQSHDPHVPYLVCRGGKWSRRWDVNFETGRYRRDIGRAVGNLTDQTCQLLCTDDLTGVETHSPPWFSQCPDSVTLHPTGDSPNVTHTWDTPIANDTDGYITRLEHIVGPESPAMFVSALSPGSHHVISYMATDNDNLRWSCDFSVNAEIPDCPPILHIENGNVTCTNDHTRDSNCTIMCNHGYNINSSTGWAVCQDNGTWSYGDDVPQCLPAVCGETLGGNYTDIELVCEANTTWGYDEVCWLQCTYNNTLRNDVELQNILDTLQDNIDTAINISTAARQEADDARDLADYLQIVADNALDNYIAAYNNTDAIRDLLDNTISQLDTLNTQLADKQAELTVAEENLDDALSNNDSDVTDLEAIVNNITDVINQIISDVNYTQVNVDNINTSLANAIVDEQLAKNASIEAEQNYTQADAIATELAAAVDAADATVSAAMAAYVTAQQYAMMANVEIPTHARCRADGTWEVQGEPYCIDISVPKLSCVPLVTVYVTNGQTESVATWALPTVYDNSPNVTVVRLSGPKPGDTLEIGQHVARYMATDTAGSNTYCNTYINVEARSCGILSDHYTNENLTYTCPSYNEGAVCSFTCANYQAATDPGAAACELDTNLSPQDVSWNLHGVTCEAESCPLPPDPTNGVLECFSMSNTTTNATNSTTVTVEGDCLVICETGYMLPYRVASSYSCNDDGTWTPAEFPTECIPSGMAQYAQYDLVMSATPNEVCNNIEVGELISQIQPILETAMMSYPACSGGYMCSLAVTERTCMDGDETSTLQLDISVLVTCEGPPVGEPSEASCDLGHDLMTSLRSSFDNSITNDGILAMTQLTNVVMMAETTDLPVCTEGILVGHYCAKCPKGTFYNIDMDTCTKCDVLSYEVEYHNNACTTCAEGTRTGIIGATSADQCIDMDTCTKCDVLSYEVEYHNNACTTCAEGTRTGIIGATSADQCIAICSQGSYSHTGIQPCVLCETGMFENQNGSTQCQQCPADTWTTIKGATTVDDCVAYDIYFDMDQADFALANATDQMTIVFWMRNDQSPLVSVGVFYNTADFAFVFEAGGANSQLLFNSMENIPTDISVEPYQWTMIGVVWDCPVVSLYQNGQPAFKFDIQDNCRQSETLVMSANTGTLLSGLGVSNTVADDTEMSRLYEDCSNRLATPVFSMDDLAAMRKPAIKFVPTNCSVTNETNVMDEVCAVHLCENGGACVVNNNTGYTCNCTEMYGGPFCEELLVHGNWSEWYNGSSCSVTCGAGVQLLYRYCSSPARSFYGNDCEGNNTDLVECHLEECVECPKLDSEGGTTCDLQDDECSPICPPGYVLPKGQQEQLFKCGEATQSEWVPLHRLPICAVSLQPLSYNIQMTFPLADPVPCSDVTEVTTQFASVASSLRCVENATCEAEVSITDCGAVLSYLVLDMTSALTSTVPFDLPQFYNTLDLTESIREAVFAIYMLELTVQDLLDNPSILTVVVGGFNYTVINNTGDITVQSRTNCAPGQVPTQGVCARCQRGTYTQGEWCLYCPRGSYTDLEGRTSCVPCPDRYSTLYIGARNSSECYEVEPPPTVLPVLVIVLSIVFGLFGILIIYLLVQMIRRFYFGYKEREKYDMEADRISLYTDFPDIAYNVFFKRRMVLGFDEDGLPIISSVPVPNGIISHGDEEKMSLSDEFPGGIPVPRKGHEPFAYPTDYTEPPFDYDPYRLWPEGSVPPPVIPEPDFDFPEISLALRYRMPGRSHLQQVYPLQMFGYTERIRGRTRKLLPLPAAVPIPKKLPQLLYRPPKESSLVEKLKERFGLKSKQERDSERDALLGTEKREPSVPPLTYKPQDLKPPHRTRPKSKTLVDRWSTRPHMTLAQRVKNLKSAKRRRRSQINRIPLRSQGSQQSPRSPRLQEPMSVSPQFVRSAVGLTQPPRPIASFTSRLARSAGARPRLHDEDQSHPKPSRFVVPKTPPASLPKFPTRSMLKSSDPTPREPMPSTSINLTGRKSVTIKEGDLITRPTTAVSLSRGHRMDTRSTQDVHLTPYHARPWSLMYTAGSEDANIFDLDWVSSEYGGMSRPSTSMSRPFTSMTRSTDQPRPKTPLIHPAPNIHGNIKVVNRTEDFNMLIPKTKLKFGEPPEDHKLPVITSTRAPPMFANRVYPRPQSNTSTGSRQVWKDSAFGPRSLWPDDDDIIDDNYEDGESLGSGSFFLTEVPDHEVRKNEGKGKKTSPPPPYSEVNQLTECTSSVEELPLH